MSIRNALFGLVLLCSSNAFAFGALTINSVSESHDFDFEDWYEESRGSGLSLELRGFGEVFGGGISARYLSGDDFFYRQAIAFKAELGPVISANTVTKAFGLYNSFLGNEIDFGFVPTVGISLIANERGSSEPMIGLPLRLQFYARFFRLAVTASFSKEARTDDLDADTWPLVWDIGAGVAF